MTSFRRHIGPPKTPVPQLSRNGQYSSNGGVHVLWWVFFYIIKGMVMKGKLRLCTCIFKVFLMNTGSNLLIWVLMTSLKVVNKVKFEAEKGMHVDFEMFCRCTVKQNWNSYGFYDIVEMINTGNAECNQENRKFWAKIKRSAGRPWFAGVFSIVLGW